MNKISMFVYTIYGLVGYSKPTEIFLGGYSVFRFFKCRVEHQISKYIRSRY